ncbi:hypothetical protein EDD59_1155 [Muricomes intestini]|jgi:hypothetical protein|uniref:Uncharacterized protein n=1 Tax=Muricomes intestini TaxID=1796634 RepID=A0A4R3K4J2_9FIRM|nr:hypothetical protein EDD59_1155 [Muricomes intestini]
MNLKIYEFDAIIHKAPDIDDARKGGTRYTSFLLLSLR